MSTEKGGQINLACEISENFNLRWLSTPSNIDLVVLFDDCTKPEETFVSLLGRGEISELAIKTSGSARRMWLMGRMAVKMAAARYWNIDPRLVEVVKGRGGQPKLSPPSGGMAAGHVSISHTVGAAVAAAAAESVGVDIEKIDRVINQQAVAWAFNSEELKLLELAEEFPGALSLWCAREAAAKSWGLGLLNHLNQVRVTGADWPTGNLTVDWLGGGCSQRSEIKLQTTGGYLVALATSRKIS